MARSRVHRRKSHKRRGSKRMRTRRHRSRRHRSQRGGVKGTTCNNLTLCGAGEFCDYSSDYKSLNGVCEPTLNSL